MSIDCVGASTVPRTLVRSPKKLSNGSSSVRSGRRLAILLPSSSIRSSRPVAFRIGSMIGSRTKLMIRSTFSSTQMNPSSASTSHSIGPSRKEILENVAENAFAITSNTPEIGARAARAETVDWMLSASASSSSCGNSAFKPVRSVSSSASSAASDGGAFRSARAKTVCTETTPGIAAAISAPSA